MKYDYTVISRFRNKEKVNNLVNKIKAKGFSCYNFCDIPVDPKNPDADPEEQMKFHESVKDFWNDDFFKEMFKTDMNALKSAENVILLLPAGTSSHIETGIAYGLGKKLILIGEPERPDSLYLIFNEHYKNEEKFLNNLK